MRRAIPLALNSSTYVTTGLYVVLSGVITALGGFNWLYWGATMVGLALVPSSRFLDYFTNDRRKPVERWPVFLRSGPAFAIISGMSYGLASVFLP